MTALKSPRRQVTLGVPKGRPVPRPAKPIDTTTYAGRIAARLGELRTDRGWSVEQMAAKITKAGYPVAVSSLYQWLNGRIETQVNALPYIAKAFKLTVAELLPHE